MSVPLGLRVRVEIPEAIASGVTVVNETYSSMLVLIPDAGGVSRLVVVLVNLVVVVFGVW